MFITRLYLPDFIARKNRSAIINLSSIASILPFPSTAEYSAAKSFDHHFSLIVNQEAKYLTKDKAFPIDILSSRPGFVHTPMTTQLKHLPLAITRDECAQNMCEALGSADYTSGHWKHQFMALYAIFNSNVIGFVLSKAIFRDKKL